MANCKVYLVPGFFGFTSLGALNYFNRVSEVLAEALAQRNKKAEIIECQTMPTGSIRYRADRLLQEVLDSGGLDADELHFVGHSTGGLDVRLLVTPGVRLRPGDVEGAIGAKTRSVVTLSTPHFGTPLANFFTSLQGRNLLQFLAVMATSNEGRYSIFAAARALDLVARLDDKVGRRDTFLDMLAERLLRHVTVGRDDPLWDFLQQVSSDQGAVIQLTPEGMNLFNAAVTDRPGVDYGCVVSAAPPPQLGIWPSMGSVQRAVTYAVFSVLHTLTAREHRHYPYPSPASDSEEQLTQALRFDVTSETNDGIVPSLSQVYGHIADALVADHLDVVGQFRDAGGDPCADWLPSGSRFGEDQFRRTWSSIAEFIGTAGAS